MRLFQPETRQNRALGATFFIAFAISVLLMAFYSVQVLGGEQYEVRSEENRLRPIPIPAPRGTIYDRNGEIVATSIPGFTVSALPAAEETMQRTLEDLVPFLGLSDQDVARLMQQRNRRPNDILEIAPDATFSQVSALEERRSAFPNLIILERPKRYYPAGPALGHLIGYVSEITREQLALPRYQEAGYRQGRWIGQAGIEQQYELQLGGEDGASFVEVDAMGRVVNPNPGVRALDPRPGQDLHLTMDLELQKYMHEIFPDTMKGALVAMAPSTGEVLGMVSNPGYDPNDFVGGISARLWRVLSADDRNPMLHRAIAGAYPPASTWKLATAAAGLEAGIIDRNSRMPISCVGGMSYQGRYARCWLARGHGSTNLIQAIGVSCNVYFYQVGIRLGLNNLAEAGTRMGMNTLSGIDIPGERAGTFPTGVGWYQQRWGYVPPNNEVMSLSIGQGPNSQTPLRTAHYYSAIAGNGSAPAPHLVRREGAGEGDGAISLDLSEEDLRALWDGLEDVVLNGTARLAALERWALYGKTGTAQNPPHEAHGWFAGFAGPRGEPPEIVVVAIVEHGLGGSNTYLLPAKTANFYLDRKYGHPFDPRPGLIEAWDAGRLPWGVEWPWMRERRRG